MNASEYLDGVKGVSFAQYLTSASKEMIDFLDAELLNGKRTCCVIDSIKVPTFSRVNNLGYLDESVDYKIQQSGIAGYISALEDGSCILEFTINGSNNGNPAGNSVAKTDYINMLQCLVSSEDYVYIDNVTVQYAGLGGQFYRIMYLKDFTVVENIMKSNTAASWLQLECLCNSMFYSDTATVYNNNLLEVAGVEVRECSTREAFIAWAKWFVNLNHEVLIKGTGVKELVGRTLDHNLMALGCYVD